MRTTLFLLLVLISSTRPTRAEDQPTCYGKNLDEWILIFRDKDSSKSDRARAAWALGCYGQAAQAAVPDLIDEVRHGQDNPADSINVKANAFNALIRIGAGTEITVPHLVEGFLKRGCDHLTGMGTFLYSPYHDEQFAKIGGPAVPPLLDILQGLDRDMRVCAADALGQIGPPARAAIPILIRAVEHPEGDLNAEILVRTAVKALGRIGPAAKEAGPAITKILSNDNIDIFNVTIALDGIGVSPAKQVLDRFLHEEDMYEKNALALVWLGPKARDAVPELRKALSDKRPRKRVSAAIALAHIDSSIPDNIPVLIEALEHWSDEEYDDFYVPEALARLGPRAEAALPIMIDIVKSHRAWGNLSKALVSVDPDGKECVPALIEALKSDESEVVHVTANCLGLMRSQSEEVVSALAEAIFREVGDRYDNHEPQVSVVRALGHLGPQAKSAIPALIRALKYRNSNDPEDCTVATAAARVLGSLQAEAKSAVPALIEAAQAREEEEMNHSVREAAILALGEIGSDAEAIPVLRKLREEGGRDASLLQGLTISLYQLAPEGKDLAEEWLAKNARSFIPRGRSFPEERAQVLGVMGRSSLEADETTKSHLETIDPMVTSRDPRDEHIEYLEEWFETLGSLRTAARVAIPRLKEYRKHPDPCVRMWATEALEKITAPHSEPSRGEAPRD